MEKTAVIETPRPSAPTPTPQTGVEPPKTQDSPASQDLLKRLNDSVAKGTQTTPSSDLPTLSSSDIEKIQDPFAKKVVQDLYKHLERGFNKKFEDLANERKRLEDSSNRWTPERVMELSHNPNFVEASKQLLQAQAPTNWTGSNDEWSALTDEDKRAFKNLENQVNSLLVNQDRLLVSQADESIKQKFSDYDQEKVNRFQQDLLQDRISTRDVRELIWKALNFERYNEHMYRAGLEDRERTVQEKIAGSTYTGTSIATTDERPKREANESPTAYFKRIAEFNLARLRGKPAPTQAR